MSRFAEQITLTRDEALDVLDTLNLALRVLRDEGFVVEAVAAQESIELIEDRLTSGWSGN